MDVIMRLLGLGGLVFSILKISSAWEGKSGVPIGTLIGGALVGPLGARVGGAAAGEDAKEGKGSNIGGLIFYVILALIWGAIMIAGFSAE